MTPPQCQLAWHSALVNIFLSKYWDHTSIPLPCLHMSKWIASVLWTAKQSLSWLPHMKTADLPACSKVMGEELPCPFLNKLLAGRVRQNMGSPLGKLSYLDCVCNPRTSSHHKTLPCEYKSPLEEAMEGSRRAQEGELSSESQPSPRNKQVSHYSNMEEWVSGYML